MKSPKADASQERILYDDLLQRPMGLLFLYHGTIRATLLVGAIFEGRVLPVAFSCFPYRWIRKGQNILEHALIVAVMSCFPPESRPLLILERGYARVALLQKRAQAGIPFLVRAKKNVGCTSRANPEP